jgi:hypothetical protein
VVLDASKKAALDARIEVPLFPASKSRPADLLLGALSGHGVVCDFAVTHPLQPAYLNDTAAGNLVAADRYGHSHKTSKVGARVAELGYEFRPCVVDAFGNWSAPGKDVLTRIAESLSARDGRHFSWHLCRLIQRCAKSLALSNARALLQRDDPEHVCAEDLTSDCDGDSDDDEFDTPTLPPSTGVSDSALYASPS